MSKELVDTLRTWSSIPACVEAADLIERQSTIIAGMLRAYDAGLRIPDAEYIREARSLSNKGKGEGE